jgi:hypothetical protein
MNLRLRWHLKWPMNLQLTYALKNSNLRSMCRLAPSVQDKTHWQKGLGAGGELR